MTLSANTSARSVSNRLLTPSFVVAVVLLGLAAVLAGPVSDWMGIRAAKKPLPLKAPLGALNAEKLAPYRLVERHLLEPTIVEALGTDRYLLWTLEDESRDASDPLRFVNLFVTYYSGGVELVPHTPDVCYFGSGYQAAQPHENQALSLESAGEALHELPVRVCTFERSAVFGRSRHTVVYTFYCNGRFVVSRTGVRLLVNHPGTFHAFYSKVEVSFPGASREQSVEGARRFLARALPVLIQDHWPDHAAAEAAARAATGS